MSNASSKTLPLKMSGHASRRAAALLALAGAAAACQAGDGMAMDFSGFGTLGAVVTDSNGGQFRSTLRQPRGATKSVDFGVDSNVGAQARVAFNPLLSATAQVVASRRDHSERPRMEWLYAQADPAPWASLRLGRMALPTYLISDSRNVGYAMHWLRAPSEMYAAMPISTFDGAQLLLRQNFGNTNVSAQASLGKGRSTIFTGMGEGTPLDMTRVAGINLVVEHGPWTLRLGSVQDTGVLTVGIPKLGPTKLPPIKDAFHSAGLQYDDGALILVSEYFRRKQDSGGMFDASGWYVSSGYRLGSWTPYASYGAMTPKGSGLPPRKGETLAAGLRWDFARNMAFKTQLESTTPSFQFVQESKVFRANPPHVKVLSLAIDFVF